jgi:hypothetical protein
MFSRAGNFQQEQTAKKGQIDHHHMPLAFDASAQIDAYVKP